MVLVYNANIGGILMGSMLPYIAYMDPMGYDTHFSQKMFTTQGPPGCQRQVRFATVTEIHRPWRPWRRSLFDVVVSYRIALLGRPGDPGCSGSGKWLYLKGISEESQGNLRSEERTEPFLKIIQEYMLLWTKNLKIFESSFGSQQSQHGTSAVSND